MSQEGFLRAILDCIGDGVVVVDTQERFICFNPAAQTILGFDPRDTRDIETTIATMQAEVFLADGVTPCPGDALPIRRAIRGESSDHVRLFVRHAGRPDGFWIGVTARPLFSPEGVLEGGISVLRDVTSQRNAEERLRGLTETLERRVAEKTALLESQARALARSNEDLERFATVASHDLQEPLRLMTSYLQLLTDHAGERLDAESRLFIQQAAGAATRMQALTADLLAYAAAGTRDFVTQICSCEAALRRALTELSETLHDRHAVVTHDPLPDIAADEMRVTQLFLNLIGNAVKFCQQVPPRVHISAERHLPVETTVDTFHAMEGPPQEWLFSVSDNGIGIDAAYTEQIFQLFKRLHDRKQYPGTGVGLAICKQIVERHGGRIWVDARPGVGSTFKFTLPGIRQGGYNGQASPDVGGGHGA